MVSYNRSSHQSYGTKDCALTTAPLYQEKFRNTFDVKNVSKRAHLIKVNPHTWHITIWKSLCMCTHQINPMSFLPLTIPKGHGTLHEISVALLVSLVCSPTNQSKLDAKIGAKITIR
jgi:hypothetical protein